MVQGRIRKIKHSREEGNDGIMGVMEPKASVIVPCWNVEKWVEDAVNSVLRGTFADFEVIAVDDGSTDGTRAVLERLAAADGRVRVVCQANRGPSAARNRGLDAARGEYVFFLDGDDTFEPEFLSLGVGEMSATGADCCIFPHRIKECGASEPRLEPLRADYHCDTPADIRSRFIARFIGYSMEHVRRWYGGTPLFDNRELGNVYRCVYRRALIERYHVRFDENVFLYEDALFNCDYLLRARKTTCRPEPVYNYVLRPSGLIANRSRLVRVFRNKLTLLRARQALNKREGGALGELYAASCVFALLEMFALLRTVSIGWSEGRRIVREYASDPEVRAALRVFPLSWRHPALALAVLAVRAFGAGCVYALAWMLLAPFRRR